MSFDESEINNVQIPDNVIEFADMWAVAHALSVFDLEFREAVYAHVAGSPLVRPLSPAALLVLRANATEQHFMQNTMVRALSDYLYNSRLELMPHFTTELSKIIISLISLGGESDGTIPSMFEPELLLQIIRLNNNVTADESSIEGKYYFL